MNDESLRAWLTLRAIERVGPATLAKLAEVCGSPEAVLRAPIAELRTCGCNQELAEAIVRGVDLKTSAQIEQEIRLIHQSQVAVVSCFEAEYPSRLNQIADPPPLLYVAGRLDPADVHAVAIVGSRRSTPQGRAVTEELSRTLAQAGFTIVSGLARGIDAAAHRGALAAGGRTIAVLGCGIDHTYPPEHEKLRRQIEMHGAVLSELAMGAPPHSYHFPRRNRIISGLSLGVLVTEAALDSGSLITARLAGEQGREVFALPGSVRAETSRGPHRLIKDGAKLVETAQDVIEELLPQLDEQMRRRLAVRRDAPAKAVSPLSADESRVIAALSADPVHIDELTFRIQLGPAAVSAALLSLEMKGLVEQLPGQFILRL
ncbi:MAG: DNA-processing protein DprA [Nitrospiraceae bacterium]